MNKKLTALLLAAVAIIITTTYASARRSITRDTEPGSRSETLQAPREFNALVLDGTADYELILNPSKAGTIEVKYTLPKGGMEKVVIVEDKGNKLIINGSFKTPQGVRSSDKAKMKIKVYYATLTGVDARGTGDIKMPAVKVADRFDLSLAGTGDIELGTITAKRLNIRLSGTGDIKAGAADCNTADISLQGTGDIELKGIKARDVTLSNSGTGDLEPSAIDCDMLSLSNTGTGDVEVKGGSARVLEVRNTGAGDVKVEGFTYGNINVRGSRAGSTKINGSKY